MKYNVFSFLACIIRSPPTRGAWIEMLLLRMRLPLPRVAPHTGGVD